MSAVVVDASVGVKWFAPEVLSTEARAWKSGPSSLNVPRSFFDLELANILWKKVQRGVMSRIDADLVLAQLPGLPVIRHSESPLLTHAFDLATATKRTVYDSLYLALAIHLNGRMLTADQRLINSITGTQWAPFVVWVGDQPS